MRQGVLEGSVARIERLELLKQTKNLFPNFTFAVKIDGTQVASVEEVRAIARLGIDTLAEVEP